MELGTMLSADLRRMREEIDRVWDSLIEESTIAKEREVWQWVEELPKFEGTGRRSLKSRSNKTIRF